MPDNTSATTIHTDERRVSPRFRPGSAPQAHLRGQDRHWADRRIQVRSSASAPVKRTTSMLRKIAAAVIATTMLVAPALAADAAKSAAPVPPAARAGKAA